VFYGALSVHLGAFLLLRVSPLLEASWLLSACVVALGLSTAIFAAMTARVQTDVKSGLAYASLTQVGLITAEIGLGLRYLALIHIMGHACLRTLQLLRAPTLLQDYHALENAIGGRLPTGKSSKVIAAEPRSSAALYRLAINRGWWDVRLEQWIVQPFVRFFRILNQLEQRWTTWLGGRSSSAPASHEGTAEARVTP
jgi:NAD(P)H-quinone oxidoreductase subunit 5